MEGISDLKIVGIDAKRPPRLDKKPYIDLFFQLNHQAPKTWCTDFNTLLSKHKYAPKVEVENGLYIATWVRGMEEIEGVLQLIKDTVTQCSSDFVAKVAKQAQSDKDSANTASEESSPQGRLNRVVASLNFE